MMAKLCLILNAARMQHVLLCMVQLVLSKYPLGTLRTWGVGQGGPVCATYVFEGAIMHAGQSLSCPLCVPVRAYLDRQRAGQGAHNQDQSTKQQVSGMS